MQHKIRSIDFALKEGFEPVLTAHGNLAFYAPFLSGEKTFHRLWHVFDAKEIDKLESRKRSLLRQRIIEATLERHHAP